jgi:hypothetical protein
MSYLPIRESCLDAIPTTNDPKEPRLVAAWVIQALERSAIQCVPIALKERYLCRVSHIEGSGRWCMWQLQEARSQCSMQSVKWFQSSENKHGKEHTENQGRGMPGILRMPTQQIAMIGDVGHSTSDIGISNGIGTEHLNSLFSTVHIVMSTPPH